MCRACALKNAPGREMLGLALAHIEISCSKNKNVLGSNPRIAGSYFVHRAYQSILGNIAGVRVFLFPMKGQRVKACGSYTRVIVCFNSLRQFQAARLVQLAFASSVQSEQLSPDATTARRPPSRTRCSAAAWCPSGRGDLHLASSRGQGPPPWEETGPRRLVFYCLGCMLYWMRPIVIVVFTLGASEINKLIV